MICELLGVPYADRDEFQSRSSGLLDLSVASDVRMLSLELIGQFRDADGIYLQNLSAEKTADAMREIPIWRDLPAVRAGRLVESLGNVNYGSVYSAMQVARDLDALYGLLA